jgi:damage-control phosphatase, subfamily I
MVHTECIECLIRNFFRNIKRLGDSPSLVEKKFRELARYLSTADLNQVICVHSQMMHSIAEDQPYFDEIRARFNRLGLTRYEEYRKQILSSDDPFGVAMNMAIAGNNLDPAVPDNDVNIDAALKDVFARGLVIDHGRVLRDRLKESHTALYLADNTGELFFDRLFIETIGHENVYLAVRGSPILNDAVMEDAILVGMEKVCKVIDNGDGCPGTVLDRVSPQFREIFDRADTIISKGQGNFESLLHLRDERIFFLLMVKCELVSRQLACSKGSFVVVNSARIGEGKESVASPGPL